jgi:hypothetical protein
MYSPCGCQVHRVIERGTQVVTKICDPGVCLRGPFKCALCSLPQLTFPSMPNQILQESDSVALDNNTFPFVTLHRSSNYQTLKIIKACKTHCGNDPALRNRLTYKNIKRCKKSKYLLPSTDEN